MWLCSWVNPEHGHYLKQRILSRESAAMETPPNPRKVPLGELVGAAQDS